MPAASGLELEHRIDEFVGAMPKHVANRQAELGADPLSLCIRFLRRYSPAIHTDADDFARLVHAGHHLVNPLDLRQWRNANALDARDHLSANLVAQDQSLRRTAV